MSTMVKRVARAIAEQRVQDLDWQRHVDTTARAAIAAMREPTEEMIDAWAMAPGAIKAGWQAMIDCALRETDDEPVAKG